MAGLKTVSRLSVSRGFLTAVTGALALSIVLASCGGGGGGGGASLTNDIKATLLAVHQGRLVDVWGLVDGGKSIDLYQADVLIGPDIDDQRKSGQNLRDQDILYDFISSNPENLQPRLLITREIGSPEFMDAYDKLDDNARDVSPAQFGTDTRVAPYSVVPRNAGLRLTFSRAVPVTEDFFVTRISQTEVKVKNTEAVQLLAIKGDPNDNDPNGDFEVIPTRVVVRDNLLIVDPVLLAGEGLQYGVKNVASGMPASPDQSGANIRLAIATAGPLRIPGIADNSITNLSGRNNSGEPSIIRDFRSGNASDTSSDLSQGFVRDPLPPRLIGQMRMFLEQVDDNSNSIPGTKILRIFKNGINHEIDRGDVLRLVTVGGAGPEAIVEILTEPADDLGKPDVQHVSVVVREPAGVDLEELDPSNPANSQKFPGYPGQSSQDYEDWLTTKGPRAVLAAEYTHERPDPNNPGKFYGDNLAYFVTFNPTPIQDPGSSAPPNQDVSPFAGAIIRFNKPVDMRTVRALDSLFFATRDVLSKEKIGEFLASASPPMNAGLVDDPAFLAKFRTPHLLFSRAFDEDGSQTAIRLQPTLGFYLDDVNDPMRQAVNEDREAKKPLEQWRYNYYFHLVGGANGVRDLSGNELDFQVANSVVESLVMPFSLDTRVLANEQPRFAENLVAYVVRRFANDDEDERPSLYIPAERPPADGTRTQDSYPRQDMFGPITYLSSGELLARTASRFTRVVDNLNQLPPPPQTDVLRWCPVTLINQLFVNPTATVAFGAPLQNPLNPFGCRLQTVWREIDLSLSRTDPDDFNLDVEQMYWAPFAGAAITFDEFDQISLFLGHSEYRPEPCLDVMTSLPVMPNSGLKTIFAENFAHNENGGGQIEYQPLPHPAYVDAVLTINGNLAITEPNKVNRFLPLPTFIDATKRGLGDSLFVYRDETVEVQGGVNGIDPAAMQPYGYIISPFLGGRGNYVTISGNSITFNHGVWYNGNNLSLTNASPDNITGGLVGPIALPLLADFWTYPDSANLPEGDPFRASGANGWQVSLGVTSAPTPNFRAFSAGFRGVGGSPTLVGPSESRTKWEVASGGFTPSGGTVQALDNTVYWIMVDFLKRTTVATSGFVEITNPHRMPAVGDPRLGPYSPPKNSLPDYAFDFEPPLSTLPAGTAVVPEFRGTGAVDSGIGFPWQETKGFIGGNVPTPANFPLDPLKAGDVWIRHWDERNLGGQSRRSWTHLYNRNVTAYTEEPNDLSNTAFTNKFGGPNEVFAAEDVKYFNWRLIMRNNVTASPPVSPKIESFAVSYRFVTR